VDISSAESGKDGGETNPAETEKLDASCAEKSSGEVHSEDAAIGSGNLEMSAVLAYGPAQRSVDAPEIKAHQASESSEAPEIRADQDPDKRSAPDLKKEALIGSALVPFAPQEKEKMEDAPRADVPPPRFESLRSRGMQAALVAACIGIAWACAGAIFSGHSIKTAPQQMASLDTVEPRHPAAQPVDSAETRRLADEVRALKKELDSMRSLMAQNPAPEELHALKKSVDALKNGLDGTKTEIGSSLAQLSARLDRAQHDPAKLREISDRLDHIEHAAPVTTASIAPPPPEAAKTAPVPLPPAKTQPTVQPQTTAAKQSPTAPNTSAAPEQRPQLITNWVVRDVYDGIALVEGPHGSIEVIEGETIPGVGTVKSIEKRASGWIVLTSRGLVDSARN
jgi:hypothetical protein